MQLVVSYEQFNVAAVADAADNNDNGQWCRC